MTDIEEKTKEKIIQSALILIMENGIGKTSLNEVAYHAGVSRVTVYRYFENKKALVKAVFLHVEQIFVDSVEELQRNLPSTVEMGMEIIGKKLQALPSGDAAKRADELKRIYPDVYAEMQTIREAYLKKLFHLFSAIGQGQDLFREGLNRDLVQAVFWELTVNFFDNPRFKSFGLNDAELYYQVSRIFLYGVAKRGPALP